MKQIDFKAWNTSEISKVKELTFMIDGTILATLDNGSCVCSCGKEHCLYPGEIIQYTGLKDKNGVKIYEGDIVKFKTMGGSIYGCEYIMEVKWKGDEHCGLRWIFHCINNGQNKQFSDNEIIEFDMNVNEINIEVIGNKFKNPNLLINKELGK